MQAQIVNHLHYLKLAPKFTKLLIYKLWVNLLWLLLIQAIYKYFSLLIKSYKIFLRLEKIDSKI